MPDENHADFWATEVRHSKSVGVSVRCRQAFFVAFLTLKMLVVPLVAQQEHHFEDLDHHVIWNHEEPTRPVFLPEAELQADRRLTYPVNETLESYIERAEHPDLTLAEFEQRAFKAPARFCTISSHGITSHHVFDNAPDLAQFFKQRNLLVQGEVLRIVPGWSGQKIVTMIYARVDDILWCRLHDDARVVEVGDIVSIAVQKGVVEVDGKYLCNATDASLKLPKVGDQVILLGYPSHDHSHYIGLGTVHRVIDGIIEPQPLEATRHRKPLPLEELKAALAPSTKRCAP